MNKPRNATVQSNQLKDNELVLISSSMDWIITNSHCIFFLYTSPLFNALKQLMFVFLSYDCAILENKEQGTNNWEVSFNVQWMSYAER